METPLRLLRHKGGLLAKLSCLAILLAACDADDRAASTEPTSEAEQACRFVSFEELYQNPLDYNQREICLSGRLQVADEAMGLYPIERTYGEPPPVLIYPGLSYGEALDRGFRTRDLIAVSGTFVLSERCLSALDMPAHQRPSVGCSPTSLESRFVDAEIVLIEPVSPWNECIEISIEDLYQAPSRYDEQFICTEGIVARQDRRDVLAPALDAISYDTHLRADLRWHFLEDSIVTPIFGERVRMTGLVRIDEGCLTGERYSGQSRDDSLARFRDMPACVSPITIHVYDMEVQEAISPWDACQQVEIQDVMRDPLAHEATLICSSGFLRHNEDINAYPYMTILASPSTNAFIGYGPVQLPSAPPALSHLEAAPDGPIEFIGYIDTWEECFLNGTPTPTPDPESTTECRPYIELELLEATILEE